MRKTLAPLLLAAVPVLVFSACNGQAGGSSGVSGAVPDVHQAAHSRMNPFDTNSNDLHAGGATFPAYAYNHGVQPVGCALVGCSSSGPGGPGTNPQAAPGAGSLFASAGTTGTIYYCLTGSGDGRGAFEGSLSSKYLPPFAPCAALGATPTGFGARRDPLDFAGSDVAMPSTEYTNFYKPDREPATGTNWGEPFEFPVIGGPIVYGYRPADFPSKNRIRLSRWTYCAIANGTISNWDDAAITQDNGHSVTGGKSEPITFYFRSDGSGTTYNFVYHLDTVCKSTWKAPFNADPYQDASKGRSAAWTFGPPPASDTWNGPGSSSVPNTRFIGESGNPGVLAAIESTAFSTGYLEGAWAKSASSTVSQTIMQSTYSTSTPVYADPENANTVAKAFASITSAKIEYGMGSDGLKLGTSRPECVLYIPNQALAEPPSGAYPIIAASYMLFYGNNNGVHITDKKKLISYMLSASAHTTESSLEYATLSSSVLTAVHTAFVGTTSKPACIK